MANKTLQLKIGNTTYRSSVDNTLTNEDLNNVTLPGLYNAGGSNSVTNKPSGIDHFGLLVIHRASGSYYIQIIYNDSKSYRRFCTNGTWSNWTEDKLTDTTYTSLKNPYALTLKFNSGVGTTYDGSSAVTYDITKTALGMNKVDNTADVDKNVKHAKTADSATTATTLGSATIGSNSCGIYLNAGKPVKMNATVGDAHTPIYFLNGTATACSLTKASVGLGSVDNTADANKSVKSATKLQTYKSGNSTSTYGDEYPLYARWEDNGSTVKLTCDNYTVKTDYATTAGSANSVAWGNVSGKPSTFTPASHTHTKSQITDFPTSLKNPAALTVQTNGTTAATYDGSAAKTVNITKSSIGLGNVDNTADSAKSVNYAASAGAVAWANVSGKPSTFAPADHAHGHLQAVDDPLQTVSAASKPSDYDNKFKFVGIKEEKTLGLNSFDGSYATVFGFNGGDSKTGYCCAIEIAIKPTGVICVRRQDIRNPSANSFMQWTNFVTADMISDSFTDASQASEERPLSSSAGYNLNIKVDKLDKNKLSKTDIADNLNDTSTNKALSANQGKVLNETKLNQPIYSTTDLTPGVSDLADGQIYIVYYN